MMLVSVMNEEDRNIDGVSYDCNWCRVSFTTTPIKSKWKGRYYCSRDCSRAGWLPVYAIPTVFAFLVSIPNLLFYYPEMFSSSLAGLLAGLALFSFSIDIWNVRRKTPKGSRKE